MSRISNERIKVLTQGQCEKYSRVHAKDPQRMHKHTVENFSNYYKSSMK